jgi:uncharacterized protein (UPF0147 family)
MGYREKTATTKRISKEERRKKLLQKKTNLENLALAIGTLENIQTNYSYKANRNSNKLIRELLDVLQNEDQNISLSIRAANAISILDGMTQDRSIESHIRTMLWQVVSNLEAIRE